jgi:hypothetical protein
MDLLDEYPALLQSLRRLAKVLSMPVTCESFESTSSMPLSKLRALVISVAHCRPLCNCVRC